MEGKTSSEKRRRMATYGISYPSFCMIRPQIKKTILNQNSFGMATGKFYSSHSVPGPNENLSPRVLDKQSASRFKRYQNLPMKKIGTHGLVQIDLYRRQRCYKRDYSPRNCRHQDTIAVRRRQMASLPERP